MRTIYITLDVIAIVAVAVMLYLTEEPMADQPTTEPPEQTQEQRIHSMLDDAMLNEYDISTWTADDIVADLLAYADLRDDEGEDEIKPHVITWKMKRSPIT
jgi:hypothetical protein